MSAEEVLNDPAAFVELMQARVRTLREGWPDTGRATRYNQNCKLDLSARAIYAITS